jgi:hypothetical protein
MKSSVYSWRLSAALKRSLEEEAAREARSVAELLEAWATAALHERRQRRVRDVEEQARLQAQALAAVGALAGGDPRRAERARALLRGRLERRHAARRAR